MRTTSRGMTLLEVMVVVAIIGVLMALSVPNLKGVITDRRVSATQRAIYLETLEARQQARRSRQPVRLAIINSGNENGELVPALRWEQLDCANADTDQWGTECPMTECLDQACGTGGCTCSVTGTPVPLPPELEVESLEGLCWLGGETTRVVERVGDTSCAPANPAPAAGSLRLRKKDAQGLFQVDQVMNLNGLTGALKAVDCTEDPRPGECPAPTP
ncbi:Tfp pilus assembly protein FimT/FimU [Pyxidicoccus sp. 3LG]